MKTFATRTKHAAPSIRRSQPSCFGYRGSQVKAQQSEIRRILHATGAQPKPLSDQTAPLVQRQEGPEEEENLQMKADTAVLQRQEMEEEEEPLQRKFESVQRQAPEEEEEEQVLQGKSTMNESSAQFQSRSDEAENRTGMPDQLKMGLEQLSGMDLSSVRVLSNSSKPSQLNALAYTQGQDIHLGPGQEKHLPHEGWHAVQQMQGRVNPRTHRNGASINDDPGLEREADVMGAKANRQRGEPGQIEGSKIGGAVQRRPGTDAVQRAQGSVVQMNPLAFAGLSAEAWAMASTVAGVIATVGGMAAGTYVAVAAGQNRFASLLLPHNLMSNGDKGKLKQIAYFRIINMYVERFLARPENSHLRQQLMGVQGPPVAPPAAAGQGPVTAPGSSTSAGAGRPTGAPTASAIDQAVLVAVKNSIQTELQTILESNPSSGDVEFKWGEDDTRGVGNSIGSSGSAESVGVTGFLQIRNIEANILRETLSLTREANAAVGSIPGQNTNAIIHRFIGATLGGRATWSAWDNLAVNVEGGAAQQGVHTNGSVKLIIRTHWYWSRWGPDSETWMESQMHVRDDGGCDISGTYEGTP